MIRNLFFLLAVLVLVGFQSGAQAYYNRPNDPYPYPAQPYPYPYPSYPSYPQPYQVTCYAQGMVNGAYFYGVGPDVYTANRWALFACQSTGQYCQFLGCR